jgi:hypothetical protein
MSASAPVVQIPAGMWHGFLSDRARHRGDGSETGTVPAVGICGMGAARGRCARSCARWRLSGKLDLLWFPHQKRPCTNNSLRELMAIRLGPSRFGQDHLDTTRGADAEVAVNHLLMIALVKDRRPLDSAGFSWSNIFLRLSSVRLPGRIRGIQRVREVGCDPAQRRNHLHEARP